MIYNVTTAKAEALRATLANSGADKARVRKMRNGTCRVNLRTPDHRAIAQAVFVELNACTSTGGTFDEDMLSWGNGAKEAFLRFLEP